MMLLPIALAMAAPSADQLLDKLTNRLKNGFAVDYTLRHTDLPGEIKCHYELGPPLNSYFRATRPGDDFIFVTRKEGAIEIEMNSKQYYEIGPMGDIFTTNSSLSLMSTRAFPYMIGRGKPKTAIPSLPKFRYVKEEAVDSVMAHRIAAGEGKEGLDAWITTDGRLLRYTHNYVEDYRPTSADLKFGAFTKVNPAKFTLLPPKGFRPLALPRNPQPMFPGQKVPASGWVDRNNQSVSLPIKGMTMLVVTRGDCTVSTRARDLISEISQKATVMVLSDSGAPRGLEKYPIYRDPAKSTIDRFMSQGTPLFIAVNGSGVILQAWMGYDRKEHAAIKKEMLGVFDK